MNHPETTVWIVDDDPSLRKALSRLLLSAGLPALCFASPKELLAHGAFPGPGCILLDVQMPGLNGLELQNELLARRIETPIIFLTGHGDIPMSVKAMKSGAVDFLTKPFNDDTLLQTISLAIARDHSQKAARDEKAAVQKRLDTLTIREREVLDLVVKGLLNKQIAAELGASEKTIKVHRGRVMEKMAIDSVAELVLAMEKVKPPPAAS
jgi:FixJ family two-component response regulator